MPTVSANLMNARFVSTVVVELVAARNVLAADKAGDSDPYITFVVEGAADQKKLKSKVVPDNVNPEWNQVSAARPSKKATHVTTTRLARNLTSTYFAIILCLRVARARETLHV